MKRARNRFGKATKEKSFLRHRNNWRIIINYISCLITLGMRCNYKCRCYQILVECVLIRIITEKYSVHKSINFFNSRTKIYISNLGHFIFILHYQFYNINNTYSINYKTIFKTRRELTTAVYRLLRAL